MIAIGTKVRFFDIRFYDGTVVGVRKDFDGNPVYIVKPKRGRARPVGAQYVEVAT